MFQVNQIVKGKKVKAGYFVVLGFRTIGGEEYAQLKCVEPKTQKTYPGELALPLEALEES